MRQPLFNGTDRETFLGLSEAQIRAIVPIVDRTKPTDGSLCTGTLVAPGWVVTARHCLAIASAQIVLQGAPSAAYRVVGAVAHPDLDVALLNIDPSADDAGSLDDGGTSTEGGASFDAAFGSVEPIAIAEAADATIAVGDVAEVAGDGLTETKATRQLRFLTESIVRVDAKSIAMNGFGASGACLGDSGGPLLTRGSDGSVVVLAVLSDGSASCVGDDHYVRLDGIRDWILSVTGPAAVRAPSCGAISEQGRCLYGRALWCSSTTLAAQSCAAGQACGWDPTSHGFRCVDPATDACRSIDSNGVCRGNEALSCNAGVLAHEPCGACGVCRIDGKTGRPHCTSGP